MLPGSLEAIITLQFIYLLAALGHYLPLSMRQLDLGIAGYFMIGAYASALLTRDHQVNFAVALVAGATTAAIGALIVDSLATRVRLTGFAYAIFSLSFAESLRIILNNLEAVGGSAGFVGVPPLTSLGEVTAVLGVAVLGFWWLDRTLLGWIRTAIADDEFIVPVFGVPLVAAKLVIFAMGGALGGLAGGLYAHYVLFLRPDDFGFSFLIAIQLPIVFGGIDRFYGAVAGSLLLGIVPELARGFAQYRLIFVAGATLLILIVRPSGLITHEAVARATARLRRLCAAPHLGEAANGKQPLDRARRFL